MLRYGKVILTYTWSELDFNATTMCALQAYEQTMLSPSSLNFTSVLKWMFCSTKNMQLI